MRKMTIGTARNLCIRLGERESVALDALCRERDTLPSALIRTLLRREYTGSELRPPVETGAAHKDPR